MSCSGSSETIASADLEANETELFPRMPVSSRCAQSWQLQHDPGGEGQRQPAGKAFLDMLEVFAEFETNLRRERQMEGTKAAKMHGTYKTANPRANA